MILLGQSDDSRSNDTVQSQPRFKADYSGGLCGRLNDKWTVVVLWRIAEAAEHRIRFSALRNQIDGITQRMLTLTLRNLERDGLVLRHFFPQVPPRVEYELTELGGGLLAALECVNRWVVDNTPRVDECRRSYDALNQRSPPTNMSRLDSAKNASSNNPGRRMKENA